MTALTWKDMNVRWASPTAHSSTWANAVINPYSRANATVSDVLFATGDVTADDFLGLITKAAPVGFGDFRPFIAGDYEYQRALFKETLRTTTADRPRLNALTVRVDTPDVTDRGTAELTGANAFVPFNRTFSQPPQVFPSLRQAPNGVVIPNITAVEVTGFWIETKDASGDPVPVTISWLAHGF